MRLNSQERRNDCSHLEPLPYNCTRPLMRHPVMHSLTHWDTLGFKYLVMSAWELFNGTSVGCCTAACKLSIRWLNFLECLDFCNSEVFNVELFHAHLIYMWSGSSTFLLSPTILHCISPFLSFNCIALDSSSTLHFRRDPWSAVQSSQRVHTPPSIRRGWRWSLRHVPRKTR